MPSPVELQCEREMPRRDQFGQHRCRHRVDEPGREGDIAIPELLEVELDRFAVDADVRDPLARPDDRLADPEKN